MDHKWNINDIIDQTEKIVIITGSSSGLGKQAAKVLAQKNASVIMAARNPSKADDAILSIKKDVPHADLHFIPLDLSSLESVRQFADTFLNAYDRLDILINNAGIMVPPFGKTKEGFELQMGTNHLGHFALTGLLIDSITNTKGGRIVNVSSMAHKAGNINFDDLTWEKRKYKKWRAYGDSKIANLYFTYHLQDKMEQMHSDTLVAAAHPGWTATELQRHHGITSFLNSFFAQNVTMGALPSLYAATAKDVKGKDYYGPDGFMEIKGYPKKVDSISRAKDTGIAKKLWEVSEKLTHVCY